MRIPRRYLPSLSVLSAFEAAARTGSVTAAARELSLTQSAVSRQIKALEGQLNVMLFHRERQTIRLTPPGKVYAREVRDALQRIGTASMNLRANPMGGSLNLAVLPTFGTRWLAPRLPKFIARHPGITINLITRMMQFDFSLEVADAAIHFGPAEWPGGDLALLLSETVVPACSPELRDRFKFATATDVSKAPLLHLSTRAGAWDRWLGIHGLAPELIQGMLFDQFATAAQAAAAGLGVALLPEFLILNELKSGALVHALDLPVKSTEAYYLAWPTDRAEHPPLVAFREWLIAEAQSTH